LRCLDTTILLEETHAQFSKPYEECCR
jgi:hypothetical protein